MISLTTPPSKRKTVNKTTLFALNTAQKTARNDSKNVVKTEPNDKYSSYGQLLRASLNQAKLIKATNNQKSKKEEECLFYIDLLRRVELINFRKNDKTPSYLNKFHL